MGNSIKFSMTFLLISFNTLYTLLTEPPGSHYSPERKTMVSVSDLYMRSYLKNYDCYVNHAWFFWANDLSRDKKVFNLITLENLQQAPDSSIIIWEIIIVRD